PDAGLEVLAPGIELRAVAPRLIDGVADAAVATAQHGLEERIARVVPAELDTRLAAAVLQQEVLGSQFGRSVLACPLEGRVRLGNVVAGADPHPGASAHVLAAQPLHTAPQLHNAL